MARTIRLVVLLALIAVVTLIVVKLRSSRAPRAELGGSGALPGSFDTWPDVPIKKVA